MEISDKELLNFAIENGIINPNTIRKQFEMNERKKFIEMHEPSSPAIKKCLKVLILLAFWRFYFCQKSKGNH